MTAVMEKLLQPRRYRAWCESCQDGYQGGPITCIKWSKLHNETRHPDAQGK